MQQAKFKMDNAHHTMYVWWRKSHHVTHQSRRCTCSVFVFCQLCISLFSYLSKLEYVCFSWIAVVSVYSLATIYIFRCMFSRVLFVLVCTELYAITTCNTSKLPTLPRVISCLSLSWILNWENSALRKIAFSALLSNLSQSFWESCTYTHETHILELVANFQLVPCLFHTFLQLFLL